MNEGIEQWLSRLNTVLHWNERQIRRDVRFS